MRLLSVDQRPERKTIEREVDCRAGSLLNLGEKAAQVDTGYPEIVVSLRPNA
jgi:hypothetical protein